MIFIKYMIWYGNTTGWNTSAVLDNQGDCYLVGELVQKVGVGKADLQKKKNRKQSEH